MYDIEALAEIIRNQKTPQNSSLFKPGYEKGLKHYQSHYLWTLIESLQNNFPTLVKALSENNFNYFAQKYVIAEGSPHENLDEYGKSFPLFLGKQPELDQATALVELAQVDWLLVERFITLDNYVKAPKGTLIFWQAIQTDDNLTEQALSESSIEFISLGLENDDFYLYTQEVT